MPDTLTCFSDWPPSFPFHGAKVDMIVINAPGLRICIRNINPVHQRPINNTQNPTTCGSGSGGKT